MNADHYKGCLLGLAVGDALGTTLEFKSPGSFAPLTDIEGGGPFALEKGQWTDDTSMALCLAASLVECKGFDAQDQMHRYLRWYREGYFSSKEYCFDIGNTVRAALEKFEREREPLAGLQDPRAAGNGSIMRLAPVVLRFACDPFRAVEWAALSSKTTHAAVEAVDACRLMAALLVGLLQGESKADVLGMRFEPVGGLWRDEPLTPKIEQIAAGSYKVKAPPQIRGTGYVVDSLEAALWAFYTSDTFAQGALKAVNLGDDADTTGAVYGQIAGAYYGVAGIPREWVEQIWQRDLIAELATALLRDARDIDL
jgi:ADP-ribosyl-[dinitrogen reductase] hydrolase